MKHLALLTIILMAAAYPLYAQYSFTGTITDQQSRDPLPGAHIQVVAKDLHDVTDDQGRFSIPGLEAGTWTLKVSFVGYETQELNVTLPAGEIHVKLAPQFLLEEVVIRALRAETGLPTTQKTLSRPAIEREYWGQDAVLNLERMIPSVLAYSEAGSNFANYALMRLRGIDQTRINITLNGVPLNDMIDQGVFFSNFTDFSNNVQSVQVQRGVGTSTNGTSSYAGSINYESIAVKREKPEADLQFTGGSFGSLRASAGISSGLIRDHWAFSTRFSKTYSQGYKFHSGTKSHSLFFSGGYFGEKNLFKLTLLAGHTRNELAYLPVLIDHIKLEPRTNYLHPGDEDNFKQQLVQLQHSHRFGQGWSITSSLYYGGAGGDFPFGFDDGTGNLIQQNFPLENDHYGLMTTLSGETANDWHMDAGLHGYIFKRRNEEGFLDDKANPYYLDHSQKNELSVFAKASKHIGPWQVYGDLQLRRVNLDLRPDLEFLELQGIDTDGLMIPTRVWTFFNPKVGFTYQVSQSSQLYLSWGRNGREPTRADILGSTVIGPYNLGNVQDENSVRAEYVNDLEVGVNLARDNLKMQANVFYMTFENEIAPTGEFIPEGFVQLRQNIPRSYRTGMEIDWRWSAGESLRVEGQATFMQSGIKTFTPGGTTEIFRDVRPILSPDWLINGRADYNLWKYLSLGVSARFISDSFLELTNQKDLMMPGFFVANAHMALNWKAHELLINLNNLFDKRYFTNGAPVDSDFDGIIDGPGYLVQAPRHVYFTLRLKLF